MLAFEGWVFSAEDGICLSSPLCCQPKAAHLAEPKKAVTKAGRE